MQSTTKPRPSSGERRSDLDVMGVLVVLGLLVVMDDLGIVDYSINWVVDLVGDSGSQFPDGCQFPGLKGLCFADFFFGNVTGHNYIELP